jgi:6-phosphogluconolactonase
MGGTITSRPCSALNRTLKATLLSISMMGLVYCGSGGDDGGGGGGGGNNGAANQFAYVVNSAGDTVQAYAVDGDGNFTAAGGQGLQPTGDLPHDVDVDKKGRFVYISNHNSNFISGYKVNSDGSLAAINPSVNASPVTNLQNNDPTDNNPHSSAFDQTGQFLYVIAGLPPVFSTLKTYTINGSTGTLTQIGTTGPIGQCLHGHRVRITPNNNFLYVACELSGVVQAFSRDTGTGQLTDLGATVVGGETSDVTIDPKTKFLFASNTNSVSVYTINGNGTLSPILNGQNNFAAGNTPHALTVDPSGQFLYTANINRANISAFRIDQATGALTPLAGSPFSTGLDPNYILVHPDGKVLFTADQGSNEVARFTVNADGTLTQTANAVTFPSGNGTNGIAMTKF